jgi:hypothetical protein
LDFLVADGVPAPDPILPIHLASNPLAARKDYWKKPCDSQTAARQHPCLSKSRQADEYKVKRQKISSSDKSPRPRRCSLVMKHLSFLKTVVLTVALGLTNLALANPGLADKADQNASQANLSTSVIDGKGTITYNGKKVWQGAVTKDLKAFSKATSTAENGLQKNTEYAAVWDGNKLVWENAPGAGAALEPEREKQERELEKLKRQLRN